jgi:hypothetical protein
VDQVHFKVTSIVAGPADPVVPDGIARRVRAVRERAEAQPAGSKP